MFRYQTIDVSRIPRAAQLSLARRLYDEIFSKIWLDINFDSFLALFFPTDARKHLIYLIYDRKNSLIGYLIFRVVALRLDGKGYQIARLSTNVLPEHTGNNLVHQIVFRSSLLTFLAAVLRGQRFMILFTANTPKTYCLIARRSRLIYPSPQLPFDARLHQVLLCACKKLRIPIIDTHKLISQHTTALSIDLKKTLSQNIRQDAFYQFYLSRCPDYSQGASLVTALELGFWQGMAELLHQARYFWRNRRSEKKAATAASKSS